MRKVKTGISDESYIEIVRGLKEGETVVSGPYRAISKELKNGSKVVIKKENRNWKRRRK
jgi:HlyD family secretion protein